LAFLVFVADHKNVVVNDGANERVVLVVVAAVVVKFVVESGTKDVEEEVVVEFVAAAAAAAAAAAGDADADAGEYVGLLNEDDVRVEAAWDSNCELSTKVVVVDDDAVPHCC